MQLGRIFQDSPLHTNETLTLDARASHYVGTVLRAKVGDELTLFNGLGGEYAATITMVTKKHVLAEVGQFNEKSVESPIMITLAQGMARGERMDLIVQKAVELGVYDVMPLVTERCNVRLSNDREEKRLAHWEQVAISACEQSGRNHVPMVHAPLDISDWLPTVSTDYAFVLSPHVNECLPESAVPKGATITLLIGPEGGLTDDEVAAAVRHGFKPLKLGPRILRAETATLAAVAAIQLRYGDLGG